jgi:DNA-binding NarL/FixJ family response regulator
MLTEFEGDVEIQRALEAGGRGYLLKGASQRARTGDTSVHERKKRVPPEIAVQLAVHMSDDNLTVREIEVLEKVAGGNRNRDIADLLRISEETVKVHVEHIMEKLGARDRTQAIAIAVRGGIIHSSSPDFSNCNLGNDDTLHGKGLSSGVSPIWPQIWVPGASLSHWLTRACRWCT